MGETSGAYVELRLNDKHTTNGKNQEATCVTDTHPSDIELLEIQTPEASYQKTLQHSVGIVTLLAVHLW